ncbi:Inner tegument protein [Cacatuid alphaherpesvirus 2]|uniref:Inner tegument protein n=1 Tax=Cacatuid alphaherpesvirus 2 TaxID=2604840 RepID=A0A5B9R2J7_9ALPH|nr:Inner tegument protein [Cacatuid alphaherpesvirus 2]QEG54043.1 Inner tegument protein [Cacatuid alphaherpesvirus 2]
MEVKNTLETTITNLQTAIKVVQETKNKGEGTSKLTSLLIDFLLSRSKITFKDLESLAVRKRLAEAIFKSCKYVPTHVADVVSRLSLRSIVCRITVNWNSGENFAIIKRVRDVLTELMCEFDAASEKELHVQLSHCVEYKNLVNQWLSAYGSMVLATASEQQLFEEVGGELNPSKFLANLMGNYQLLFDHVMVQEGIDYLGNKLQSLVGYHALLQSAGRHENSKVNILTILTMATEYFGPDVKPAYRKLPQKVQTVFDINATEEVVAGLVYDYTASPNILCGQTAFPQQDSMMFAEAVRTRNILAAVMPFDDCAQTCKPSSKKQRAGAASTERAVWRCGLENLFSIPVDFWAMDLPSILYLFYESPVNVGLENERALSLYVSKIADIIAKFPDDAASGGLEVIIRSLVLRGFTRTNCEKYLAAAEGFWDERTTDTPIGDFLGAIMYASIVGLAAHTMYTYSQRTVFYPQKFSGVLKETIDPYVYLLNRMGMTSADILRPLKPFSPQPLERDFLTIRDTLAAVVDSIGCGSDELADLIVYDYVQKMTTDLGVEIQYQVRWLSERDAMRRGKQNVALETQKETSFCELASVAQTLTIEGEELGSVSKYSTSYKDMSTFAALFAATVVRDVLDGALAVPFETNALARLYDVLSWVRDFGVVVNMPDSGHYRRHVIDLQTVIHPFVFGKLSAETIEVKHAREIEAALEKIYFACEQSLQKLPRNYTSGLRPINPPSRKTSILISQAYSKAAVGDLGELVKTLSKTASELSEIVKALVSKMAAVQDLFSKSSVSDDAKAVTINTSGGKRLGTWRSDDVMGGLWKTITFTETAVRNAEKVVRKLESTKNRTSELENAYWQLLTEHDNSEETLLKQVADELTSVSETRKSVLERSRAVYRAIAASGLRRIRDLVKAWRLFLKAEQKLEKPPVHQQDLMEALSAVAFAMEANAAQAPDYEDEQSWKEILLKYGLSEDKRYQNLSDMLGSQISHTVDDCITAKERPLITPSSDVKTWADTNASPLSVQYSFSPFAAKDFERLIPPRIIPVDEALKVSDQILHETGNQNNHQDLEDAEMMY